MSRFRQSVMRRVCRAASFLVQTPLSGPDGNVYALAQGTLVAGVASPPSMPAPGLLSIIRQSAGFRNGANVVRAVVAGMAQTVEILEVEIVRADFTTARCAADALNSTFGEPIALDPPDALPGRMCILK